MKHTHDEKREPVRVCIPTFPAPDWETGRARFLSEVLDGDALDVPLFVAIGETYEACERSALDACDVLEREAVSA